MFKLLVNLCRAAAFVAVAAETVFHCTKANKEIAKIKKTPLSLPKDFSVTAHSGAMATVDNSLPSVRQIAASGVDIIEMDVTFRPDGTAVIKHDATPKQHEGALLSEALDIVHAEGKMRINLDLKAFWNLAALQDLIIEHKMLERVFYTGVDENEALRVKNDSPLIPFYLNHSADEGAGDRGIIEAAAARITELGAVGINLSYTNISPLLCEIMHEKGLLVSAFTVNKSLDLYRLLALCVDNITTKRPLKLMRIIKNYYRLFLIPC